MPRVTYHHSRAVFLGLLMSGLVMSELVMQSAMAQPLSAAERALAVELETQERGGGRTDGGGARTDGPRIQGLERTLAGREGKQVVIGVQGLGPVPNESGGRSDDGSRRAVVTSYDYQTGVTTRTTWDLATRQKLDVKQNANYPTSLAAEEIEQAFALLSAAKPELAPRIAAGEAERKKFQVMAPIFGDSAAPRFGHRVVSIRVTSGTGRGLYYVDLSTREVEKIQ